MQLDAEKGDTNLPYAGRRDLSLGKKLILSEFGLPGQIKKELAAYLVTSLIRGGICGGSQLWCFVL